MLRVAGKSPGEFHQLHRPRALGKRTPGLASLSGRRASPEASCGSVALSARCSPAKALGTAPSQGSPQAALPKLALGTTQPEGPRERGPQSSALSGAVSSSSGGRGQPAGSTGLPVPTTCSCDFERQEAPTFQEVWEAAPAPLYRQKSSWVRASARRRP